MKVKIAFLDVLFDQNKKTKRDNIVSHSRNGEFAYRKDGWKIVYALPERNLNLSRGKAARIELYHLETDTAESDNVLDGFPDIAENLRNEFNTIVDRGTSREGENQANDVEICFDTIQTVRWADK